ncbi:MAG: OmpA family protein [Sulfitobacter sp.]
MRPIFIASVAIATLLTFYSALWFKSEKIEADITQRVANDLAAANPKAITVAVDGRHVTLSGIVDDTQTETTYLNIADETYGALGPIDGLTLQNNAGFVKAVKSDAGITLIGAVPSEDDRAALLAAAAEGTQGEVIDELTVGATDGAWTSEAGFGLSQMGQLSSGALSVTPDSYTLSGTANGDASSLRSAVADRAGWQTFVSAPTIESDLSNQLSALQADVSERDASIARVSGERDTLVRSVAALTAERDTATADLETLRNSLDDTQSDTASLRNELSGAKAALETASGTVAERDATIEGLNGLVSDLTANSAALSEELEAQKASLNSDQQAGTALRAQLAQQSANIDAVSGDLAARDATIATLEGKLDEATTAQTASAEQIDALTADVTARDAVIAGLDEKVLLASDAQIASQSQIATLTDTLATRDGTVATLTDTLATRDREVVDLTTRLEGLSQDTAKLADLSAQIQTLEDSNKGLTSEVAAFGAVIASKDATIANLRTTAATPVTANVPAGTAAFAAQCSARAGEVLENTKINFASGTANIQNSSIDVLERLTGITLACADSGLGVEIGGHTDSQGSDETNQTLSERRATAIADFMFDRGVPTSALTPVGYGETQPIGDNATPEGRAQNRRISFEWQTR